MPESTAAAQRPFVPLRADGAVICALLLLAGCAAARTAWTGTRVAPVVDVFYATDRGLDASGADAAAGPALRPIRFGGDRGGGPLSFGRVPVRLPPQALLGRIPPLTARGGCARQPESACIAAPMAQDEDRFGHSLRQALARSPSNDVLVFVHGYNFPFEEAVLWAAQLKHDVGFAGVVILYSWPSQGSRWAYLPDITNVEWTSPHLAEFLDRLASQVGDGARVHVLAHSMGAKAAVSALHALAVERREGPPPHFGQIILAAPDIDADVFGQVVPPVRSIAERVTLYTAADFALRISGWLFAHRRAGDSHNAPVLIDGVDTVDVTSADGSGMRHNYFLENERVLADIFQLLAYGSPPQRRFRLFSVRLQGFMVWQFRS